MYKDFKNLKHTKEFDELNNRYTDFLVSSHNNMIAVDAIFITAILVGIFTLHSFLAFIPFSLFSISMFYQLSAIKWMGVLLKDETVLQVISDNGIEESIIEELYNSIELYAEKSGKFSRRADSLFVWALISLILVSLILFI